MGTCCSADKVEPEAHDLEKEGARSPGTKSTASLVSGNSIASSKNRSCTDVIFLFLLAGFTIVLLGLIIYCSVNGDIYRIVNGYDNCGNVCGMDNEKDPDFPCKGKNLTNQKLILIRNTETIDATGTVNIYRECVSSCNDFEGFKTILNRCTQTSIFSRTGLADFLEEAAEDLQMSWREVLYMCLLSLLLSAIVLLLFRFVAGIVIWAILGTVAVTGIAGTIYLWVRWSFVKEERMKEGEESDVEKRTVSAYLAFAIAATIVTIIIILVILVMRKRIQLVAQLFKESGKALSSMPLLYFNPLWTFISLAFVCALWLLFAICIESSGFLHTKNNENMEYKKDGAMKFTRWYNLLSLLWYSQFVIACQQMVIAGAVSKWFFTRNKDNLGYPILNSYKNLVRYHLGTVCFGSLIIAILQFVRAILAFVEKCTKDSQNSVVQCLFKACQCCLMCFEKILQYLSRNAYIITAMHGDSFCKAGRQAFKLLTSNALRVAAINSVGDFVLLLAKVFVVIAVALLGLEMLKSNESIQHLWIPITLGGLFAFFVAHSCISIYEMTIDTIFLCFCEDCELNDGLTRPYYMSRGLMEFVENSKKALEVLDANVKQGWSGTTTRSVK